MGIFKKSKTDGANEIVCTVCNTPNKKLLKAYLKSKKHPKINMIHAGGIAIGTPSNNAARMWKCNLCGGYFCDNCEISGWVMPDGRQVPSYELKASFFVECPICHKRLDRPDRDLLKEYE